MQWFVFTLTNQTILIFNLLFFREKGRKRKREGKKHGCVKLAASCTPRTTDWPAAQACPLSRNQTSDPLVCSTTPNLLSQTSQSSVSIIECPKSIWHWKPNNTIIKMWQVREFKYRLSTWWTTNIPMSGFQFQPRLLLPEAHLVFL